MHWAVSMTLWITILLDAEQLVYLIVAQAAGWTGWFSLMLLMNSAFFSLVMWVLRNLTLENWRRGLIEDLWSNNAQSQGRDKFGSKPNCL